MVYKSIPVIPVHSSNVSSNRIKIQEILLILQLETDYFSKLFISEMHSSSGITVFTGTSRTAILHEEVLQDSSAPIPAPILQGYPCSIYIYTCAHYTTHPSREFSIQKSNSTCRRQKALRVLLHYRFQKFYA